MYAERAGSGWRRVSYAEALRAVRSIGTALLLRGLSDARPVAVLSDNSVDHALLALACQYVGIPVAPISQAYSLMSKDHAKLKAIFRLLDPGLVYVGDEAKFAGTLAALDEFRFDLVSSTPIPVGRSVSGVFASGSSVSAASASGASAALRRTEAFDSLLSTSAGPAVDAAFAAVGPDTIAKFLFTSGSTGEPKGVINTQRMLCSNQVSWRALWPFLVDTPPVLVDWMPWNHTFGGNADCNMVLANGGTLYIDDGKPAPGLIEKTAANLKEIAPTIYLNVPRVKAIAALAPLVQDIVLTGHDRDFIGFLLFPNLPACRNLASDLPAEALPATVLGHEAVKSLVHKGLRALQLEGGGSSTYAQRALFLDEPPNIDAGEITDKGYINQRAVLQRRVALVEVLQAAAPVAGVIVL